MARVVPSQVVDLIDKLFPLVRKELEQQNLLFKPGRGDSQKLIGVMDLIDQIPTELIALSSEDYAHLTVAIAAIKATMRIWWPIRDYAIEPIEALGPLNPVTVIRRCLALCPDQSPSPSTTELSFIPDDDLRLSIRTDISAANQALSNGEWKAATVLAGAAVEALLLWSLQNKSNPTSIKTAITDLCSSGELGRNPPPDLEKWDLHQMITVSHKLSLIKPDTRTQAMLAKDFRNLIHPGRAQRMKLKCDRGTAMSALAAVELVVRDLT